MKKVQIIFSLGILLFLSTCSEQESQEGDSGAAQTEAQQFINAYTAEFVKLYYASSQAEWKSNTEIREGDTTNAAATQAANEAMAAFTGSEENINKTRALLEKKDFLIPIQIKQLERILYGAANNPATVPDLVSARIKAETAQNEQLFGYNFVMDGDTLSTNEIDEKLGSLTDVSKRKKVWELSKEVGQVLKPGLAELRDLRNQTVQALGYSDYFTYQVSDYGMETPEMMDLLRQLNAEVWPLYRELHTWARYELAKKYGEKEVPEMLPAHWLPNRWGQDWAELVQVEGIDLDAILEEKGAKWLVQQAERFYISLGFKPLPKSFYELSSLYPLPEGADYKKNNHASAWHMDLERDVRSLMSVEPNTRWYETTHHELGHIYYYLTYTNKDVPPLLREGANRGYHEAMGSLLGLAAMQKPFIEGLTLIDGDVETDEIQTLLKEALNYIVFIPWSAGVMSEFEHDLYAQNLPLDQFNQRWWELKKKYQGLVPPGERGEDFCDAASKTHINNDAAQYYDYAISYVLLFQFHDYISKNLLNQDPHATNYFGNEQVGHWLKSIMYPGASRDWRDLLKEKTGEDMSARAMLEYFQPLMEYLKAQNEGRVHTLPETL